MKIRMLASTPSAWRLLGVAVALSLGLGMSSAGHAESYDEHLAGMIDRAKTDAQFASRVREAGPEAYPLLVLIAADYNFNSPEYRRFLQQRGKGGRN